jgi:hypothetical protein
MYIHPVLVAGKAVFNTALKSVVVYLNALTGTEKCPFITYLFKLRSWSLLESRAYFSRSCLEEGISLHKFPESVPGDPERSNLRRKWKNVLQIGKQIPVHASVCSIHFKPEDFKSKFSS